MVVVPRENLELKGKKLKSGKKIIIEENVASGVFKDVIEML